MSFVRLSIWVVTALILGCAGPRPPQLPKPYPAEIETIELGQGLNVSTVRRIAGALSGKYPSLKQFLDDTSDAAIESWASLLSRYWLDEATRGDGLLHLLDGREPSFFRSALCALHRWGESGLRGFWRAVFVSEALPKMAEQWFPLVLDESARLSRLMALGDGPAEAISEETARNLASELRGLLADSHRRTEFERVVSMLTMPAWLKAATKAASQIEGTYGVEMWKRLAIQGVRWMAAPSEDGQTKLGAVLDLAQQLDHPSGGLFTHLHKVAIESGAFRQLLEQVLAKKVRMLVAQKVSTDWENNSFSKEEWLALSAVDSPELDRAYQRLFNQFQKSLKVFVSVPSEGPGEIRFERTATLTLHAVALTEWVRAVAQHNKPLIEKLPEAQFQAALFREKLALPAVTLEFMIFSDRAWVLSSTIEGRLRQVAKNEFVEDLKTAIAQNRFSNWAYDMQGSHDLSVAKGVEEAIRAVDWSRPIFFPREALSVIWQLIGEEGPLPISSLETPNILVKMMAWFRDQTNFRSARNALSTLILGSGISKLSNEDKALIESLFKDTPWHAWGPDVINRVSSVAQWLEGDAGGPALEWFYLFLQGLSNDDLVGMGRLLSRLSRWQLFQENEYPSLVFTLRSEQRLTWVLQQLHWFGTVTKKVSPSSTRESEIGPLLSTIAVNHSKSMADFLEVFFRGGALLPSIELPTDHRRWLQRFSREGGVSKALDAFRNVDRQHTRRAFLEMVTACEDGTILRLLRELRAIRDLRLQVGIDVLITLERSGELRALLQIILFWLS